MIFIVLAGASRVFGQSLLVPMDQSQKNHLKAYGLAYWVLQENMPIDWLLNYRGGSFLFPYTAEIASECMVRGVTTEILPDAATNQLLKEVDNPSVNMYAVRMEKAPRIAVYSPKNELIGDETDAVILVLNYAEIPYVLLYDEEVLRGDLALYDWVHLHHEDFTGQPERFQWRTSHRIEAEMQKMTAQRLGYSKVSEMKYDVALKIKDFCATGGYLFAMCSAAETLDIALAAEGNDLSETFYLEDGENNPSVQQKLDFSKSLAFENFTLEPSYSRKFSDINSGRSSYYERANYFNLFSFSAKWDIIPSILTQNHETAIKEFHGLTTAFSSHVIKPSTLILAENKSLNSVRYIYGEHGKGHWTFYGGHDPEGTPGRWDEPTDLNLHTDSPGYRLILNNVLFPSAQKKKQKT